MAQYKVLQDIEADDKLLGPLSLRQFIYAVIVFVLGFVGFRLGAVNIFLAFPFVPPMIFFGLLAAPFGRDQPSEVWLLAKIRFFLKSRKRIWDQAGVKELVTITAPKRIERVLTKGFSDDEVKSRLKALSSTLDTRGWAVKNIGTTGYQPMFASSSAGDRLVDISNIPQETVAVDPASDVLNEETNPLAAQVDQSLQKSSQAHRQALLEKVRTVAQQQGQTPPMTTVPDNQNTPPLEPTSPAPLQSSQPTTHSQTPSTQPVPTISQTPVTPPKDPAILKLVKNNDLNIATISRQANKKGGDLSSDSDEVVISLR